MDFSVLMSVYHKENPEYLRQSLDSIFAQTLLPTEVVLVEDGPLTPELDAVVAEYEQQQPTLRTVKLRRNVGLGRALNEGLRACRYDLVARMDTDDISRPERFERQMAFMEQHPDIDVLGSWIDEFVGTPDNVVSTRRLPELPEEIAEFAKVRNPINHPSCVFRRQAVDDAGGYEHFYLFEDYYLWVRMLLRGSKFYNLQQSLLLFRMSGDMFQRRGGRNYARSEIRLQHELHQMGYISWWRMVKNITIRRTVRMIPNSWRQFFYLFLLRK